jgi:hypothetical protein
MQHGHAIGQEAAEEEDLEPTGITEQGKLHDNGLW